MQLSTVFRPKLLDCLRGYRREDFFADLMAGVTVGVVALPLALAFGIASGVDPRAGLTTAIVAGFLISALGGSRVQIGGPTGAFVAIVYGVVASYGLANLVVCTLMAGGILVIMGLARMGSMIKFIPYPVTMGFTCGIAVLIFSTQIRDFLGLTGDAMPADFVAKLGYLSKHLRSINPATATLAAASLGVILAWPKRWARVLPGSIVALLLATGTVVAFDAELRFGIETIGSRFGGIPDTLPWPTLPSFSLGDLQALVRPATTIALLAAIESLLCAVVADGMIDDRHDSNQELIAQGLANMGSAMFGGMPATGAIARTATNVRAGARTPVAGIIHAAVLLGILLVAAPLASRVPLGALSAVLVVTAWNMGEWHMFARLKRWPRSDVAVFLTAFALTVLVDLTVAVEVGMVLAAVLFIKRIAETTHVRALGESAEDRLPVSREAVPEGVLVYGMVGAFFFGAADKFETALKRAGQLPRVLILRMDRVLAMDATGLNALEDLREKLQRKGRHLLMCGPHTQPLMLMDRAGFVEELGRDNLLADLDLALERARVLLQADQQRGHRGHPSGRGATPGQ